MNNWNAIQTNQNPGVNDEWKKVNVNIIANFFRGYGWTDNAIAGLLGNMDIESFINPAQFEIGSVYTDNNYGFGLVQWTSSSRIDFINWAGADWLTNYDKQLQRIIYELNGGYVQWIPVSMYNYMTFQQYTQSTESPEYLVMVFERSYERGTPMEAQRTAAARKWYDYLQGYTPGPTPTKKLPVWLLFKIRFLNGG